MSKGDWSYLDIEQELRQEWYEICRKVMPTRDPYTDKAALASWKDFFQPVLERRLATKSAKTYLPPVTEMIDPNDYNAGFRITFKLVDKFTHPKAKLLGITEEKEVTQYQALLPVDLERHLYAGSTLYDLEKHEFRKISTVSKVSRKTGYTTTITFTGGAKKILANQNTLEEFGRGHKWVSLRDMPEKLDTIHHTRFNYPGSWTFTSGDTNITEHGRHYIEELVDKKVLEVLNRNQPELEKFINKKVAQTPAAKKKRRWFK